MFSLSGDNEAKLMLSELTKVVPEFAEIYVRTLFGSQNRTSSV